MIKLEPRYYGTVYGRYLKSDSFFPLIGSVLLGEQDGVVYVDNIDSFAQVYVEHNFGFSQLFGRSSEIFERELERYLFVDKAFDVVKIRFYTPNMPKFLLSPEYELFRSYRQRFTIDIKKFDAQKKMVLECGRNLTLSGVTANNIALVEEKFGVVGRFWRTQTDFMQKSKAMLVFYEGQLASICYAAAEADRRAEIDVLTLKAYQNLGCAKLAVVGFVKNCLDLATYPLWDCFTNNAGSMALCKSVGFISLRQPYPFFTINK